MIRKKHYIAPYITFDSIESDQVLGTASGIADDVEKEGEWDDAKASFYEGSDFEEDYYNPIGTTIKEFNYSLEQNW